MKMNDHDGSGNRFLQNISVANWPQNTYKSEANIVGWTGSVARKEIS